MNSKMPENEYIIDVLIRAKKIITDPSNWTTEAFARDTNDFCTGVSDPDAIKFCSSGAIEKALWQIHGDSDEKKVYGNLVKVFQYMNMTCLMLRKETFINFNDKYTHEEVLDLFDEAIVKATKIKGEIS